MQNNFVIFINMKKIFFIIIFTLSWVNISQAKVIDLYCEFIEGKAEQKDEIQNYSTTDYTVHQKFSEHFRGVRVKIDITKKKVLKISDEDIPPEDFKTIFNDDEMWFYWQELDTDFYVHYILNRYTGKLRKEMRQLTGNPKNDLYIVQIFNCLKAKQLF